jgi:hypothetical protein
LETWVKRTQDFSNKYRLLVGRDTFYPYGLTMEWDTGNPVIFNVYDTTAGRKTVTGPATELDRWTHVAGVYDRSSGVMRLYYDGVQVASSTVVTLTVPTSTKPLRIGGTPEDPGAEFPGLIDEVRLWNVARSASEISASMSQALTGGETGLVALYHFDAGNSVSTANTLKPGGTTADAQLFLGRGPVFVAGVAEIDTVLVPEDSAGVVVRLGATEPDGGALTWTITANPTHGTLNTSDLGNGRVTYIPAADYNGSDSIGFRVTSGGVQSTAASQALMVRPLNDAPVISTMTDRIMGEEAEEVAFTVSDVDNAVTNLTTVAHSFNPTILPDASLVIAGTGASRTLTITPQSGVYGSARVTVTVSDGELQASTTFQVSIMPDLAYTVLDLGSLEGSSETFGLAVDNAGRIGGYGYNGPANSARAFIHEGILASGTMVKIDSVQRPSRVYGLAANDAGVRYAVGEVVNSGVSRAFLHDGATLVELPLGTGPNSTVAYAVNTAGTAVGYGLVSGVEKPFQFTTSAGTAVTLPSGTDRGRALSVNDSGDVAGYVQNGAGGAPQAMVRRSGTSSLLLTNTAVFAESQATGINKDGVAVGYVIRTNASNKTPFLLANRVMTELGTLAGSTHNVASAVNSFQEVVGTAQIGQNRTAFIYTRGRLYKMNDLLPENTGWDLAEAQAINNQGHVVGTGYLNGRRRAFLAVPANTIGKRVYRPGGTVARMPSIQLISSGPGDNIINSFFYSEVEKSLYAIRPVLARLRWPVSESALDTNYVESLTANVWPERPQIHVGECPVEIEPRSSSPYRFLAMYYSTSSDATVNPNTKLFNATNTGYNVLRFLKAWASAPDPTTQSNAFTVARTVRWNDATYLQDSVPWTVGTALSNTNHKDYTNRNGYVFFPKTALDAYGENRAYSRDTREGAILPVNTVNAQAPVNDSDFVVVWYGLDKLGVAWPNLPSRYSLSWPTNAPKIIIASAQGSNLKGSDPITSERYPEAHLYIQPDASQAGFNPNEEHARLLPGEQGGSIYAIRNDLNALRNYSDPFCLLKYRDAATKEWRIKVYQVVMEQAPYYFSYPGVAGVEVQPPLPLSILKLYGGNQIVTNLTTAPWHKDYLGKIYARAAGTNGQMLNLVVRFWYPLQSDFFYDLAEPAGNDVAVDTYIPWLDQRSGGSVGVPVNVTYRIRWPDGIPVLQVGQTLLGSAYGLPGVKDMARLKVIYDGLSENDPSKALARLIDPLSERYVKLGAGFVLNPLIQTETDARGRKMFRDLPYPLRIRVSYDEFNKWLYFGGVLDESQSGVPLLLPNIMSAAERDTLKALDGTGAATDWDAAVQKLYVKTRNPNDVDLTNDGQPDDALLSGLRQTGEVAAGPESLGDQPKALSAALLGVPPAPTDPGQAISFNGTSSYLKLAGSETNLAFAQRQPFTIEFWLKPAAANGRRLVSNYDDVKGGQYRLTLGSDGRIGFERATGLADSLLWTSNAIPVNEWRHVAAVYEGTMRRIYVNGVLDAELNDPNNTLVGATLPPVYLGAGPDNGAASLFYSGQMDELRIWNTGRLRTQIADNMDHRMNVGQANLVGYWQMDEGAGSTAADASGYGRSATLYGPQTWVASTAPTGRQRRYVTLVENDDVTVPPPVNLHIIEVGDGPFKGDVKYIAGDNPFDERVTLRHSSDYAGDPGQMTFEWYYKPNLPDFNPTDMPVINPANGLISDARGWMLYRSGAGVNYITIGEGGESGLLVLSDNWFICRYKGYNIDGTVSWSDWIGDPAAGASAQAMLCMGWVKRVIAGLNPFDARTTNFNASASSTVTSMLRQAGPRYEGDIAMSGSAENLNRVGLIEAYETVLRRARRLSVDGTPAVNYGPANDALLMAASRISDLYILLGNEAYADAADPTIGFSTASGEYGQVASSIFAFQNQLDSLLEEELGLLRGRDDSAAGVGATPVYNRLFWNFTMGDGELAYSQVYNITDVNEDGKVDEVDAKMMFPQGHGDAWGHYLTAVKTHYQLLRHPKFTWVPQSEYVLVSGVPLKVDFTDERKFATAAAAKAKTGREILDLTYRLNYVDDPNGQWQGYYDTDPDRAWGVAEWGRRAGQGALFDWLVGNAILPDKDDDPAHKSIDRIDRTTVVELDEVAAQHDELQALVDKADQGLNPLGLAKGVVPFDLDPSMVDGGMTHFEQIYERAISAMKNAIAVFDEANKMSESLRDNQDTTTDFTRNTEDQERDFNNRLIELFGYPYAGDIGPGKTYPSGYGGPDLIHYMYVNTKDISDQTAPPSAKFQGYFTDMRSQLDQNGLSWSSWQYSLTNTRPAVAVSYPFSAASYAYVAPAEWGQRRAPGELQLALSDLVQQETALKQTLRQYDNLLADINEKINGIEGQYDQDAETLKLLKDKRSKQLGLSGGILVAKAVQVAMSRASSEIEFSLDALCEALPKVVGLATDATSAARAATKSVKGTSTTAVDIIGDVASMAEAGLEMGKEETDLQSDIDTQAVSNKGGVQSGLQEALQLMRAEAPLRLQLHTQREVVQQTAGRFQSLLAQAQRVIEERNRFRARVAGDATKLRYKDMAFRVFRNDAIQKYRAQYDLAARYVYLAATAYDYEANLLGSGPGSGRQFMNEIIRQRALGQMNDDLPVVGRFGLADPLARMALNFAVLKTQMGFNNPQTETGRFSLRRELFRIRDGSDAEWREVLKKALVKNLWDVPEFRRYCRPFAPEAMGSQPGLVLRFPTTVTFGLNFFGWPLSGGDSAYDPTQFATKIRSVGVWFSDYNGRGMSMTPRIYLVPVGADVLRSPNGDDFQTRMWRVVDQKMPLPLPLGPSQLREANYIPAFDSLSGTMAEIRRFSSFRAYHDSGWFDESQAISDSRLIGRSVWNTQWMLIIPGGTLLNDANQGLETFVNSVSDVKVFFQTYAYSGN